MTAQEAERALEQGLRVVVARPETPQSPYVGRITDALDGGYFCFAGRCKTEVFSGIVRPEEISFES